MTFTLAIRFPWGRYHGTPWGRNVNEGVVDWPPEPWRVIRALYATWKHRAPELDADVVERALSKLAGAPTYSVPEFSMAHTRHYLPDTKYQTDVNQSTDKVLDTFVVVHPEHELCITWSGDLEADEAAVLSELSEQLPYLGRAESLCIARLVQGDYTISPPLAVVAPGAHLSDGRGTQVLLTAAPPLDFDALQLRPWELRRKRRIDPPGTLRVEYPSLAFVQPRRPPQRVDAAPVHAVRFHIVGKALPSRTAVVAMTHIMRAAAMKRYREANDGAHSVLLTGKSPDESPLGFQHRHAHYLAFTSHRRPDDPDVNFELLDTITVWSPEPFEESDVDALASVARLYGSDHTPDFRACRLGVEAFGDVGTAAPELIGPAIVWESFTPFIPPRHRKRKVEPIDHVRAEVERELRHRGFPAHTVEPVTASATSRRSNRGWLDFHRHRPNKVGIADAPSATGLRLVFHEPVEGPIAIGGLSHFGMGLFMPVDLDASP